MKVPQWNHRWFGFWSRGTVIRSSYAIEDYIDPEWSIEDFEEVREYMMACPTISLIPSMLCFLCEKEYSSVLRTDGVYVWNDETVTHFYEHSLVVPENLIEHIRERNYIPPDEIDVDKFTEEALNDMPDELSNRLRKKPTRIVKRFGV